MGKFRQAVSFLIVTASFLSACAAKSTPSASESTAAESSSTTLSPWKDELCRSLTIAAGRVDVLKMDQVTLPGFTWRGMTHVYSSDLSSIHDYLNRAHETSAGQLQSILASEIRTIEHLQSALRASHSQDEFQTELRRLLPELLRSWDDAVKAAPDKCGNIT